MTLTEEQRLRVERDNAVDDAKNYQEQIEVMHLRRENELRQMNDMGYEIKRLQAIIDTPPEEAEWKSDLEVLDIATQSSTIDIEIAKKWHSSYRKAQNSNLLRKQENELLRASLVEHEEHENQTHVILGAILGTDDTLENVAKRAAARIKELEAENKRALLELQKSKNRNMCEERVKKDMQQAARIKELEDALVEELARGDYFDESQECEGYWWDRKNTSDCTQNDYRRNARLKLQAKGKIGPDAGVAHKECKECSDERLLASLVEHENQTHAILGAILGTDDTLENVAKRAMARIAELEKWLKKERSARLLENSPGVRIAYLKENEIDFDKFFDGKALEQLKAEGKIGPDARPPYWQITEERVAALATAVVILYGTDYEMDARRATVIQAMLEEAEQ